MAKKYITAVSLMQSKITVNNVNGTEMMKPKVLEIEAYTITETSKLLGYKSTKSIYKLLDKGILNDYIWHEYPNKFGKKKVYLMLEPPNLPTLAEKIKANIQVRRNNIIRRSK